MVLVLGLLFAGFVSVGEGARYWREFAAGVSIEQFRTQDSAWLVAAVVVLALAPVLGRWRGWDTLARVPARPVIGACCAFTLIVGLAGVPWVMHWHPLSMDEHLAVLQADVLARGVISAPLDPAWEPWAEALQPLWVRIDRGRLLWGPGYRPGNAALLALFDLVGLRPFAHAILGATVPLLGALVAGRLFPTEGWAPPVAALLLASSTQILVTDMTPYAMTPHLVAGLAWLVLWLRDDAPGYAGAALVGFVAIGLHQVHVHPAMALPFLVHLLWRRRWLTGGLMWAWYAAAFAFWVLWKDLAVLGAPVVAEAPHVETAFFIERVWALVGEHSLLDLFQWTTNGLRLVSWQNLAFLPLVLAGLAAIRRQSVAVRLVAASAGVLLLPYLLLMPGQGHGWGYRYLHPALGHLVVVCLAGVVALRGASADWPRWRRAVIAVGVLSVAAIPFRAVQAEAFVRPWARASTWLAASDHSVLLVDDGQVWFGLDLVRNDLFLEHTPLLLAASRLDRGSLAALCKAHEVRVVDESALKTLGLVEVSMGLGLADARPVDERLTEAGCPVVRVEVAP